MFKIRDYQRVGIDFLKEEPHRMLGDDMGLGKTFQAIAAFEELNLKKILIICPSSVKLSWYYSILEYADLRFIQVIKSSKDKIRDADIYIISYDLIKRSRSQLSHIYFDLLICDECHYLRSATSIRSESILGAFGVARRCIRKWMLTGTPMPNRPKNLYPILAALCGRKLGPFSTYYEFGKYFCGGYFRNGIFFDNGATHKKELADILKGFMLRREKKDVLTELPPITKEVVFLQTNNDSSRLAQEEAAQLPEGQEHFKSGFGEESKLRQQLALSKLPEAIAHIEMLLSTKDKIVVFAHHRAVVDALYSSLLKFSPVVHVGGLTDVQKENAKNLFIQKKEVRVFIGNILSAGTGIDGLQKVCDTSVFVEWSREPGVITQAIDRLHRMGQENPVFVQFLALEGSLECRMLDSVIRKNKVINEIIGSK